MAIGKVLTVDLAARFSACAVVDNKGEVVEEFDSWGKTAFAFVDEIIDTAARHEVDILIFEDVPYGLSKQFMIKPVLRLQGIIIHALGMANLIEKTVFLNPATWQRSFEGVFGGKAAGALAAAQVFGYNPPDMLIVHADEVPEKGKDRAKVRAQLKKASTDYVDAFLMGRWAIEFSSIEEMLQKSGVQEVSI
jgi:hypothetical protein